MVKRLLTFILIFTSIGIAKAGNQDTLFPKIEGWKLSDSVSVYNADNLWNIIDGAADVFLRYNFEELTIAQYTHPDSTYIMVECYRHKTPEMAFGIYSQERPIKGKYMKKGAEGYQEQGMLNFLVSCYYIKIRTLSADPLVQKTMNGIADGIVSKLNKPGGLPILLDIFPKEGKIENSEQLISKNFLGYTYFENTYQTSYETSGKKFNLFLLKRDNTAQIDDILSNYFKFLKRNFKKNAEGIYNVKDPYNGEITIIVKGNIIGGILNIDDSKIRKHYTTIFKALIYQ